MDKELRRTIDSIAEFINEKLNLKDASNLEEALESAGVEISYFTDKKYDGFLSWDKDKKAPVISVNATHSPARINFSIAHELGHLVLNYKWIPFNDDNPVPDGHVLSVTKYRGATTYSDSEKSEETYANEFAASFLMTNSDIQSLIDSSDFSYTQLISELSTNFNVSAQAAKIRLDNFLEEE